MGIESESRSRSNIGGQGKVRVGISALEVDRNISIQQFLEPIPQPMLQGKSCH